MRPQRIILSSMIQKVPILMKRQAIFTGCAQTLSDETPPIGKIYQFSKTAVTFKPMTQFLYPEPLQHILFCKWRHHSKLFGLGGAVKMWEDKGLLNESFNQLMKYDGFCRGAPWVRLGVLMKRQVFTPLVYKMAFLLCKIQKNSTMIPSS